MVQPVLHLIVGINGAGKTTFYYEWLKRYLEARVGLVPFINADEIQRAEGLSAAPEASYEAARCAARRRDDLINAGHTFVAETVFSHKSKLELIDRAKRAGFQVFLYVLHVKNADLAVKRVETRVLEGGHPVPEEKIRSRFLRTRKHVLQAVSRIDRLLLFDTSSASGQRALRISWRRGEKAAAYRELPDELRELARKIRRLESKK